MDGGNSVCADLSHSDDVFYYDLCDNIFIYVLPMDAKSVIEYIYE